MSVDYAFRMLYNSDISKCLFRGLTEVNMKRRTKIISAVMALAILVCVFAVLATSFAVDTSSESASFRVDAQIMGYNRVEVKIYAPAGAAGGSYTLKYDSKYMSLDKPKENEKGEQTSVTSYENGGTAITNYNFSQDSLRCSAAAPKSSSTEQLYGSYTFKFDGNYKEGSISVTAFDIYSGDETPKLLGSDKTAKCDFDVKEAPANTISLKYIGDKYYYMVSGKNDTSYSGLVNYYGTYYYVENGVLNWDYSGLTKYYGTWYYVENSELKWNYTGLTKYYGTWYYVENSVLNWNYTGLTSYYGTWYYVEKHTDKIGKVKTVAESVTQKNATHFFRKFFAGLSVFIAVIVFMPSAVSALFSVFASLSVGIFSATALPLSLAFFSRKNTAFMQRSSGGARKKMPATAEKESRKPASNTEIGERTSTTIAALPRLSVPSRLKPRSVSA